MIEAVEKLKCQQCQQEQRHYRFLKNGLCKDCRAEKNRLEQQKRAKNAIVGLLDREDVLILDTETTGMSNAEVIEVSVINTKGDVLLDTLVKPQTTTMNPYAYRVHNISMNMLQDAPSWPEILPQLHEIAKQGTVLAWNASFDARMLEQTSSVWALNHPKWLFVCAMRLYAKKRGIKPRGLHKAVIDEKLDYLFEQHASHRALGDVRFVLEVLRATVQA